MILYCTSQHWLHSVSNKYNFETGRHWSNAGMFVLHSPLTKPVLRLIKANNVVLIVVINQNNIGTGPIEYCFPGISCIAIVFKKESF